MAEANLIASPPRGEAPVLADASGWMPLMDAFLQLQRMPWDVLAAWQQAALALQKELFDEWVCRWAGGAPIDA